MMNLPATTAAGAGLLFAGLGLLAGCELLEFSPNETSPPAAYRDLTARSLAALAQRPVPTGGDTLRVVLTGDSHRFYSEAEDLVASVNRQRGVGLVVVAGDVSDFGLGRELQQMHDELQHLRVPYLTVAGNHDLTGNGRQTYQNVYGALDYTFTYAGTRFIMLNTNSRETGFDGTVPNLGWLQQQLADTAGVRRQLLVHHVPPTDWDFDLALEQPFAQALAQAPRLALALNGHLHRYSIRQPYGNGVTFVTAAAFDQRQYVVLTLWGTREYRSEVVNF